MGSSSPSLVPPAPKPQTTEEEKKPRKKLQKRLLWGPDRHPVFPICSISSLETHHDGHALQACTDNSGNRVRNDKNRKKKKKKKGPETVGSKQN